MTVATRAQIVTFRLGDDLFAADINEVERVLRYAAPTPVPNVPEWVKGVIEYRSRVVPVIDLRERFELSTPEVNGATRLMVLSANGDWVAAIVDAVLEVVPLGASQLAAPPALFRGLAAEFLRGILRRNERLIIVLDVTRLLATHERLTFDTGTQSAAEAIAALAAAGGAANGVDTEKGRGARESFHGDGLAASLGPAAEVGAPDAPPSLQSPGGTGDALGLRGPESADGGPLQLLSTSDEAPQPDESILAEASREIDPPGATKRPSQSNPTVAEVEGPAEATPEETGPPGNGGNGDDPPPGDGGSPAQGDV
jgi:purine-binding chemotaxis protein CheW